MHSCAPAGAAAASAVVGAASSATAAGVAVNEVAGDDGHGGNAPAPFVAAASSTSGRAAASWPAPTIELPAAVSSADLLPRSLTIHYRALYLPSSADDAADVPMDCNLSADDSDGLEALPASRSASGVGVAAPVVHHRPWSNIDVRNKAATRTPLLPGTLIPTYTDNLGPAQLVRDMIAESKAREQECPGLSGAVTRGVVSALEGALDRAAMLGSASTDYYFQGVLLIASCGLLPGYTVSDVASLRSGPDPVNFLVDPKQRWLGMIQAARGKGGKRVQLKNVKSRETALQQLRARMERDEQQGDDVDADVGGDGDTDRMVTALPESTVEQLMEAVALAGTE